MKFVRLIVIVLVIIANVSCDQISKKMVRKSVIYESQISIYKDNLILTNIENTGAFLSLGDALPPILRLLLFVVIPVILLCIGFVYLVKKQQLDSIKVLCGCLIIGGGIGNIMDRALRGSVTDFMLIDLGVVKTGIFNFADVSVMIGTIVLFAVTFFKKTEKLTY